MQYLSEFEILSEPIVPPPLAPGATLPFVAQGYFLLVSRLPDSNPGDLLLELTFNPTVPFPPASFLLVDYEDENGANQVTALAADNSVTFAIGSGKTVLFGIQPNVLNTAADGPLGTGGFGARGYVLIDTAPNKSAAAGTYQLAVVPEIRATFFSVTTTNGTPAPNFSGASEVAYVLPTPDPLIMLTKSKETKEKEASKDTADKSHKDTKDAKDGKHGHIEKLQQIDKNAQEQVTTHPHATPAMADLQQRVRALEELAASGTPFITGAQRPTVG